MASQNSSSLNKADSSRVCMAFAESSYDTQATHFNPSDGSTDYGIFQINSRYWCSDGKFPGKKECPFTCNQLFSLQNSIACAKIVVQKWTMTAWDGWKAKCRGQNVSKYIAGCGV
ncbi:lysozyme C-like [Astyanax mexicanus]|uniref:lysozyme C-like n=1 Tax=Astyanax mexicanus TaxID=7994 RepID=UPI0020CABE65|nr:lysozyme C-like [Astyanax mexicanus]